MEYTILSFGIARDIIGSNQFTVELGNDATSSSLRERVIELYPQFENVLEFSIAVNNEYVRDEIEIHPDDEIAIIPPVSGG
jgi:molybdopterin converting factor small subunit